MISSSLGQLVQLVPNQLVSEQVLTTVQSSITFTGLDGLADGGYRLELSWVCGTVGSAIGLQINGDTTASNYSGQRIIASGATMGADSTCTDNLISMANSLNNLSTAVVDIFIANGSIKFHCIGSMEYSAQYLGIAQTNYIPTVSNLVSLTLQGYTYNTNNTLSNCLGIGTIARLYRKKTITNTLVTGGSSLLLADIFLNSATTTINFSNLDATLHGGYYLECLPVGNGTAQGAYISFNGTTQTFGIQRLYATAGGVYYDLPSNGTTSAQIGEFLTYARMMIDISHNSQLGRVFIASDHSTDNGPSMRLWRMTCPGVVNINQITITAQTAFQTGTRLRLYRKK